MLEAGMKSDHLPRHLALLLFAVVVSYLGVPAGP